MNVTILIGGIQVRIVYIFASYALITLTNLVIATEKRMATQNFTPELLQWLNGIHALLLAVCVLVLAKAAWSDRTTHRKLLDAAHIVAGGLSVPLWFSLKLMVSLQAINTTTAAFGRSVMELGPYFMVLGLIGLLSTSEARPSSLTK